MEYRALRGIGRFGKRIRAFIALAGGSVVAGHADASEPLSVAPLPTTPDWVVECNTKYADFGIWVTTAGDVNGDGYSDVIVGARYFNNGQHNEGKTFLFLGSPAGPALAPAWTFESNQLGAELGYRVATAGDVNGDGLDDVIVSAYGYDGLLPNQGRVWLYHGVADDTGLSPEPAWTTQGEREGARYGISIGTAGDVNADGYDDVIVGADSDGTDLPGEGRVFLYLGSAAGLSAAPAWVMEGNQHYGYFGTAVSTAGDVNGDGYHDVVIGAVLQDHGEVNEGRAYVYLGSAAGLASSPAWIGEGNQAQAFFGWSVCTAGDVNGDGFSDIIVGASLYDNDQVDGGRAYVFLGSASGLDVSPAWTMDGTQVGEEFGFPVGTAGDVNGDGFADVIVGGWKHDGQFVDVGSASVFLGSRDGLVASAVWRGESNQTGSEYGFSANTAGDVNGDGFSDIVIGAPAYDNGQKGEGRVLSYFGSADGVQTVAGWIGGGDQLEASFGAAVGTAGDVNGDGLSDVVIGAPTHDGVGADGGQIAVLHGRSGGLATAPDWLAEGDQPGAELGASVARAGDVNGDGFSDMIAGAPGHDGAETDEGQALLYLGSPSGLAATPDWVAEGGQPGARFGHAVASAGDVNGDGFSDVIVGAPAYDGGGPDAGRVYVYHGSPAGLSVSPVWAIEGDQAGCSFGAAVGSAGDINGDGYSDVIIGAPLYDVGGADAGRAVVYLGSATGLTASPAWIVAGVQVEEWFGGSVATAGDVNGDGFSDVIVGAERHDATQIDSGRGLVYYGSSDGLALSPARVLDGDRAGARLGSSVGTAGDVNADGLSDFVLGAPFYDGGELGEGAAFLHYGAVGLPALPIWMTEGNQVAAHYGKAVSMAGDVDGDGFGEVIVGASLFDGGEVDEGRAFVFHGNGGSGLPRLARQAQVDGTAPIDLLGSSESPSAFRLDALGRTAAGRGQVRLEWEVERAGVPFDGLGIGAGPVVDTGEPGGAGSVVSLSEVATVLTPSTLYHWRLRIAGGSPFHPRSPWLWLPYNSVTEGDVRTALTLGIAEAQGDGRISRLLVAVGPNPFRPGSEIGYELPRPGRVRLSVFDVQGRSVATLVNGRQESGRHQARWDGRAAAGSRVPAGVYLLRLEFEGLEESRKIALVH